MADTMEESKALNAREIRVAKALHALEAFAEDKPRAWGELTEGERATLIGVGAALVDGVDALLEGAATLASARPLFSKTDYGPGQ